MVSPPLNAGSVRRTHSTVCDKAQACTRNVVGCGRPCKRLGRNLFQFFRVTRDDWLMMGGMGIIITVLWFSRPDLTHVFPLNIHGGIIYRPDLAYPHIRPIFSAALAGILAALIPLAIFLVAQIWRRSFTDFGAAVLGLGYSLVTGTCIQILLKKTIGGFRPHFLEVCRPHLPSQSGDGKGFQGVMYSIDRVCTGEDRWAIRNAMESFPSGHAEIAFAAFGFLAIYLFTHLKINTRDGTVDGGGRIHGRYWRMLLVILPIVFATYLSSTLVSGYQHHAHDVISGALIGAVMALFGYRMAFKGILSEEWNTVPYLILKNGQDNAEAQGLETSPV